MKEITEASASVGLLLATAVYVLLAPFVSSANVSILQQVLLNDDYIFVDYRLERKAK